MTSPPTPDERVPSFLVERFQEHSAEELREIASYAESMMGSDRVPSYVVQAFAMQDEETRLATAVYAVEFAEHLEEREALEDEADDDDPPAPGSMGGAFFG